MLRWQQDVCKDKIQIYSFVGAVHFSMSSLQSVLSSIINLSSNVVQTIILFLNDFTCVFLFSLHMYSN